MLELCRVKRNHAVQEVTRMERKGFSVDEQLNLGLKSPPGHFKEQDNVGAYLMDFLSHQKRRRREGTSSQGEILSSSVVSAYPLGKCAAYPQLSGSNCGSALLLGSCAEDVFVKGMK